MEESDSGQQQKRCPCGFFGSAQTSGLCSKCFKATVQTDKSQDPLDPKAEIMRNKEHSRVPTYSSHDSLSTPSSSSFYSSPSMVSNLDSVNKSIPPSATSLDSVKTNPPTVAGQESVSKTAAELQSAVKATVNIASVDNSENTDCNDSLAEASTSNISDTVSHGTTSIGTVNSEKISSATCIAVRDSDLVTDSGAGARDNISSGTNIATVDNKSCGTGTSVATVDNKTSGTSIATDVKDKLTETDGAQGNRGVKRDSSVLEDQGLTPEKGGGAKSKRRCGVCKTKLELAQRAIGRCKCDFVFCSLHRLPEQHDCQFDHKEDGRREAREKMVKPTRHLGTSFKRLDSDS